MSDEWYLIRVENSKDIGINEEQRIKVNHLASISKIDKWGDFGAVVYGTHDCPQTEETDSAPTGKSLEERVKSLEKIVNGEFTRNINILFERNETLECETISKTDELYAQLEELKNAFEAECDNNHNAINFHMNNIKELGWKIDRMKEDISVLEQAFVKYAICKPTELPQGGEVSPQPPKQSWVNKMNQRIQAAENNVNRRCNKLNQRLQKLESKANGKEGLTAAAHITPGEFVYSSSGDIIAYAVPKSTADEWTHGKPTPLAGSTEQADGPKVMTIEEAERQIKRIEEQTEKTLENPRWNLGTNYTVANNIQRVCDLKEWIENQKSIPPEPDIVEQIKAGERRLYKLRNDGNIDCIAALARNCGEFATLKQHVINLVQQHTGITIDSVWMSDTGTVVYRNHKKGIKLEFM